MNHNSEAIQPSLDKLHETGKQMADKAHEALSSVGGSVASLAHKVRDNAPTQGKLGETLNTVADQLEAGGQYLSDSRVSDLKKDAGNLIRKYPTQALLAGLAVGFLLGVALSRRA